MGDGAIVRRGTGDKLKEKPVDDFRQVMQWLLAEAERGISKQRYKGLGEMNPGQLWETTMDPASRRLLRVEIDDAIRSEEHTSELQSLMRSSYAVFCLKQ